MKFSLILILFCFNVALTQSDMDASVQKVEEAISVSEYTRSNMISKAILDEHYYQPKGEVRSLTHYYDDIPQNKWVFDSEGQPMLQFIFDARSYDLIQIDNTTEEIGSKYQSRSIKVAEDQVIIFDKLGNMKQIMEIESENSIISNPIAAEIGLQDNYLFNKNGELTEIATQKTDDKKVQHKVELKYNSDGTLKEYASNEKGNKTKIKLEYSSGHLVKATVDKKEIRYTSTVADSLGRYARHAHTKKDSFLIGSYDANDNLLSGGDHHYVIEYAEESGSVPRDLGEEMLNHYYYLHMVIDSMSLKLVGNGYARSEWVMDITRYPFLIGMRENRHLQNKPARGSIMLPSITYGPLEEIFSNEKASFYKLYMEENLEVYFNSKEKMNKHLIRMRAKYKKARFDKDEENNCVKVVGSKGYIMVKKDKKTGLWEIT